MFLDPIKYEENFFSSNICDELIKIFHEHYYYKSRKWGKSKVLDLDMDISNEKNFIFIKRIISDINLYIKKIDKNAFIDYCQIVEWPTNSSKNFHYDRAHQPYTSIIYLNDDFNGGETVIKMNEDYFGIIPKKGSITTFNGNKFEHCVKEVENGVRYTLPIWYNVLEL